MARTARFLTAFGLAAVAVVFVVFLPNAVAFGVNVPGIVSLAFVGAFWAVVIAGGVWLALRVAGAISTQTTNDDAMSMLRQRYARGEISRAEFFQMKQDLEVNR